MKASDLRWPVTLEEQNEPDSDGAGGYENITWSTLAITRAKIEPVAGSETYEEHQKRGNRSYMISIRYPKYFDFTRIDRVVWGSITLIPGVDMNFDNLKEWLTFEANTEV